MLYSMTGFSTKSKEITIKKGSSLSIVVELKTLNSRFFEQTARLPSALSSLETEILSLLKQKLLRGRAYLTVTFGGYEGELDTIVPSIKAAKGYLSALKAIQKECRLSGNMTVPDMLRLPNVFISEKPTISASVKKEILTVVVAAADELMKSRRVEGTNLQKDLEKRFDLCKKGMDTISRIFEKIMRAHKKVVAKTLSQSQAGDEEAKAKLEDLYATLNKMDINEEITRFRSHLRKVHALLKDKSVEKGKRFDFTLQELLRETNTVAAKCSNFEVSTAAVDIKVELEKAREQIQNIL